MRTFILFDFLNMVHRAKHITRGDIDMQVGMAIHTIFNSIRKCHRDFGADHAVMLLEGKSWRYEYSDVYKLNRKVARLNKTAKEKEDDAIFFEHVNLFSDFIKEKTNVTVVQSPVTEADDLIALWIRKHPQDKHIIVSTDSDYVQLLAKNVEIYDGVNDIHITLDGYFDKKGKHILDKAGNPKKPDPEWALFMKCIRGDSSDNVFSAYPGAREKGTKNKVGIREAYEDRHSKGFAWNNFMNTEWTDHEEKVNLVGDRYIFNKKLVDLNEQPEEVVEVGMSAIEEAISREKIKGVGVSFLKFCNEYGLNQISKAPDEIAKILNKHYNDA